MKRTSLACAALVSSLVVNPALAASDDAVASQLKAMQAQLQSMQREVNRLQSELSETKAQAKVSQKVTDEIKAAKAKPENDVRITMSPAPKFETADGAYSFKVGGFGQIDAGMFSDDRRDRPDGTNVRRARLNVSGTVARDFNYKLENDFAGNVSAITDAYVEYVGMKPFSVMVGQFKEPFGLETLTSDLFTSFNERASTVVFSPDRKIGLAVSANGSTDQIGAWTASVGGFGSGTSSTSSTDDEARDWTGRLTWAPVAGKTEVLHLGVAGSYRVPDSSSDSFSFTSRAENQLSSAAADLSVNTGTISRVDNVTLLGLEAAGVYGPFSLQGEYVKTDVNRQAGFTDQTFNGYYVEASYFLTGESRNYSAKSGKFDRVTPKWAFNPAEGGWGAWQVAARLSDLDLNGVTVKGGEMENWTLGLRWIPTANTSLTANYIKSNTDQYAVTANDDPDIWLMRAQFDF